MIYLTLSTFLDVMLSIYSFLPRALPPSHFWNLMLVISENVPIIKRISRSFVILTSLGSGLLSLSLQSAAHSPGGDGGVLDIAANRDGEIEVLGGRF